MSGSCGTAHRPSPAACSIEAAVRNRNGHPRWWCSTHGCQAWGPHGERLDHCAGLRQMETADVLVVDPAEYAGGIGVWGAVRPVYSWGIQPDKAGIHVHARRSLNGPKVIDRTYGEVVFMTAEGPWRLTAPMAVAYTVSNILGLPVKTLRCRHCNELHLDQFEFAAQPHAKHQCNACGRHFFDGATKGIANPVADLQRLLQPGQRPQPSASDATLHLRQREVSGLAVWGSNAAILWTSPHPEQKGIHIHTVDLNGDEAEDETFHEVSIDGQKIDAGQARLLMAQQTLPSLQGRVLSADCVSCRAPHFDQGPTGVQLLRDHRCDHCNEPILSGSHSKKHTYNPLVSTLAALATTEHGKRERQAA